MLSPSKHAHPDQTVIFVALTILKRLKAKRLEEFYRLQELAKTTVKGGETLFVPALSFLYLLGLVAYHRKNDTVEYTGPQS